MAIECGHRRIPVADSAASGESLVEDIRCWAAQLGFQQVGISDLDLSEQAPHLRRWLQRGFHGEMGYMARNLEKRLHPAQLEAGTCSLICARMNYLPAGADGKQALADGRRAYVARYALGRDYHKLVRRRLARLAKRIDQAARRVDARFRAFADSAPVLEKALAEKAGLGWMGKHTLLIHPEAGSWFFLGEIYTNLKLPSTGPAEADQCGNCKACMTVCPTGAIVGPKQLDARRCISYLTIEHKSAIPVELRPLIGNRIFGCDDCQIHCPWNREAPATEEEAFQPRRFPAPPSGQSRAMPASGFDGASLLELFAWDEADFLRNTEGSAIRRIGFQRWQRNLAVALGNGPASPAAIAALRERLPQASALVREHIEWALERLTSNGADA